MTRKREYLKNKIITSSNSLDADPESQIQAKSELFSPESAARE